MLTYDLTDRGKTPMYEYLYQLIREDILSGRLKKDEKLPSKRTLAEHLSVSKITVENAYAQLLAEGYIYSKEKKGAQKVVEELYWAIVIVLYLGISFLSHAWHLTWIIWPVAGVLSSVIPLISAKLKNQ